MNLELKVLRRKAQGANSRLKRKLHQFTEGWLVKMILGDSLRSLGILDSNSLYLSVGSTLQLFASS